MNDDERKTELVRKVAALVADRFRGDYRLAFDHYAVDGALGENELYTLLYDANVGNRLTRMSWVRAVLAAVDTEPKDGRLDWNEFLKQVAG